VTQNRIALIGEAWGEQEERERTPFVGPSGYYLNQWLAAVGIRRSDCLVTNVFALRPKPTNDVANLCGKKSEVSHGFGPLSSGKYVLDRYLGELVRLRDELNSFHPGLIIALGGTAAWACSGDGRVSQVRGTVFTATRLGNTKTIATYHPAAVLRDWSLRPIILMDLAKAERESHFLEIRRPQRFITIDPSLRDLWDYFPKLSGAKMIAVDIETAGSQVTCIGFAPTINEALHVPFTDPRQADGNYWRTTQEELKALDFVRRVLALPVPKVFQNGLYDAQFLWRTLGLPTANWTDDTMLLSHALNPELEKGLAFMGSLMTDEPAWKLTHREKTMTIKEGA
jgi:uracil-DNA glycosylase